MMPIGIGLKKLNFRVLWGGKCFVSLFFPSPHPNMVWKRGRVLLWFHFVPKKSFDCSHWCSYCVLIALPSVLVQYGGGVLFFLTILSSCSFLFLFIPFI
jgi:hypothetical protein